MKNKSGLIALAALAMTADTQAMLGTQSRAVTHSSRRHRKAYPKMVTASDALIAAWNRNVKTRQVVRRQTRPWKRSKVWGGA